jgi:hypothetical protein
MQIVIDYKSSWRNSFLNGNNNQELPKEGRNFIGSMTSLKKDKANYIERTTTKDTVMGVLSRLIGDQRKLYQARNSSDYYFKDLESSVSFEDKNENTGEVVYLRNNSGVFDQNAFTGAIKTNDPAFTSNYSKQLWSIMFLDFEQLCNFIVNNVIPEVKISLNPLDVSDQFDKVSKIKNIENKELAEKALKVLSEVFPDQSYTNKKGEMIPSMFYCASLYLQIERLSKEYDFSQFLSARGNIAGISKHSFTKREFMNKFTTGDKKFVFGNPYVVSGFVKGQGEVQKNLSKSNGRLTIKIDIDREKANELKEMIENAGVNTFFFGKKGLGYVSNIIA